MRFTEHTINNAEEKLSHSCVRELLDYHEDGYLTWKTKKIGRKQYSRAGSVKSNGYYQIKINKRVYSLHRIIYFWHFGEFPNIIDHIDRNKANNKIENLRNVTQTINRMNSNLSSRNKTGITGVSLSADGYWVSQICIHKNRIKLGYFKDFNDAVLARWKAEVKFNFINCRSTSESYLYLKLNNLLPALRIRRQN